MYLRSGHFAQLREAVHAADFYRRHIYRPGTPGLASRNIGMFDLKVTNPQEWAGGNGAMYSYNEPFASWLTGDETGLAYLPWSCDAQAQGEPTRWSPSLSAWTERHTAFHLLANVVAYDVTGEARYRDRMTAIIDDFVWHQNGAGGALLGALDGGLWHYGNQHGDGNGTIASPWMSALTVDALLRAYQVDEDRRIPAFMVRMGNFEKAASKRWPQGEHDHDTGRVLRFPDHVTAADGRTDERNTSDAEHAIDVAAVLAWAAYFADQAGTPDPSLRAAAQELYQTYQEGVRFYTRPGGPAAGKAAYRVAPDRKFSWMYHDTGSPNWLMEPAWRPWGAQPQPAPPTGVNLLTNPSFDSWIGGAPTGWSAAGSGVLAPSASASSTARWRSRGPRSRGTRGSIRRCRSQRRGPPAPRSPRGCR